MAQLRHLEKAIETSIAESSISHCEKVIDEFLNANESITNSASGKLHDALRKIWRSEELAKAADIHRKEPHPESTLTPVSSVSLENVNIAKTEELFHSTDPRCIFLDALTRLAPCLINKDQVEQWWSDLQYYAIDSTGYRLDVVNKSRQFVSGILTGSFYEYSDAEHAAAYTDLSSSIARNILELYLSHKLPKDAEGAATDERIRFVRQNCRNFWGQFARRETKAALTMVNEYFVQPKYRIDILDLVVEYLSESQNSKLFRIFETPFFESLLTCLEMDRGRTAVQLALTALSMFLVHICDKLVTVENLLYRVYACFGRACSWQPTFGGEIASTGEPPDPNWKVLDDNILDTVPQTLQESKPRADGDKTPEISRSAASSAPHSPKAQPPHGEINLDLEIETIDVIPLFTFLYGLFPINTINFCRQCDEYFAKKNYTKRVVDFWSRFMVTRKTESIIRQFRIDPLFIKSTEDSELSSSLARFQEIGSALGLTSVCTSRRIVDVCHHDSHHDSDEFEDSSNHQTDRLQVAVPLTSLRSSEALSASPPGSPGSPQQLPSGNNSNNSSSTNVDKLLGEHRRAFQMQPEGTAGHWHRELLLIRNELAFANFSRDMSEQRALRWQKRASDRLIVDMKNEELEKQNRVLRLKVTSLESETLRAVRSARTIMRERSAYESKILNKNHEFRERIKELETQVLESQKSAESAREQVASIEKLVIENQNFAAQADEKLKNMHNDLESAHREIAIAKGVVGTDGDTRLNFDGATEEKAQIAKLENQLKTTKFQMERLKEDNTNSLKALQAEIMKTQAEFAAARLEVSRPRLASSQSPDKRSPNSDAHNHTTSTMASVIREKNTTINRLKTHNDDLSRRCAALEHELRARKVHEEEKLNELQAALMSSRPYAPQESTANPSRFRGRGGAQGVPRRV